MLCYTVFGFYRASELHIWKCCYVCKLALIWTLIRLMSVTFLLWLVQSTVFYSIQIVLVHALLEDFSLRSLLIPFSSFGRWESMETHVYGYIITVKRNLFLFLWKSLESVFCPIQISGLKILLLAWNETVVAMYTDVLQCVWKHKSELLINVIFEYLFSSVLSGP